MYVLVFACLCMYVHVGMCAHVCLYMHVCVCVCVCVQACMYMGLCICGPLNLSRASSMSIGRRLFTGAWITYQGLYH